MSQPSHDWEERKLERARAVTVVNSLSVAIALLWQMHDSQPLELRVLTLDDIHRLCALRDTYRVGYEVYP